MVALADGAGSDRPEIGSGLGFREIHRPGPRAGDQLRQVCGLLLRAAVRREQLDRAERENGPERPCGICGDPGFHRGRGDDPGQSLAAVGRVEGDAGPASVDEGAVGVGESLGRPHDSVLDGGALPVAGRVERSEDGARQLSRLLDDRGGEVLVHLLAARQTHHAAQQSEIVQREGDIAQRRPVVGHSIFPGFMMPFGSRAALMARIRSRSSAGL